MAFIRSKKSGNKTYYSLVEGYRVAGPDGKSKVGQRVLAYLGVHPTLEAAYQEHVRLAKKKRMPSMSWSDARYEAAMNARIPESERLWHEEQAEKLNALRPETIARKKKEHEEIMAQAQAAQERFRARLAVEYPGVSFEEAQVLDRNKAAQRFRDMNRAAATRHNAMARQAAENSPQRARSVLGVVPNATTDEIKQAYRALAKQYHPDINSTPEAAARMVEINRSYDILCPQEMGRVQ